MTRARVVGGVAALVVVLAGCGESDPLTLPPRETSVTTAEPASGDSVVPATGAPGSSTSSSAPVVATTIASATEWVPATANLAGMAAECGTLSIVTADPDRDVVIAGVPLNGLFQSVDGSPTWEPLGTGSGSATIRNRTSSITFDPTDDAVFWQSGNYTGPGAYRTTDGGSTFTEMGDITHADALSVDLSDPEHQTMLVGKHEQPILYRSTDGGDTWDDLAANLPPGIGYPAFPLVLDAQTHLLGTYSGEASGIYRTVDGGTTWTQVYDGAVDGIPLLTSDGRIYWIPVNGGSIIESSDRGETWVTIAGPFDATATGVLELPDGRLVSLASGHIALSDATGQVWQSVGPELPYEPTGFTYAPLRNAFYLWRAECGAGTVPVAADAIMRLDIDLG